MIAELKEVVNAHKATQEAPVFPLLTKELNVNETQNLGHTMSVRKQALRSKAGGHHRCGGRRQDTGSTRSFDPAGSVSFDMTFSEPDQSLPIGCAKQW